MKSAIAKTFKSLFTRHQAIEIRIKHNGSMSGWFFGKNSSKEILSLIERFDGNAEAIYVTLNPIKTDALTRSGEQRSALTKDADIERRYFILIDVDPVRPADLSSTEEEKNNSLDVIKQIEIYLTAQGWPAPAIADSGNGYHLLYSCDMENSEESTKLVRSVLNELSNRFSTEQAKVDTVVYNAARIVKLYGTIAKKGVHTEERPHRRSMLIEAGSSGELVTPEMLASLIPAAEEPAPQLPKKKPSEIVKNSSLNSKYLMNALHDAVTKVQNAPSGQRNSTLNSEAFSIAQFVGSGQISETMAWQSLTEAAESNGLLPNEIDATLHSAFSKGKLKPRYAPEAKQRAVANPEPSYAPTGSIDPDTGEITTDSSHSGSMDAWQTLLTQWVYIESTKTFINLQTMRQLTVEAFNMTHAALLSAYDPAAAGKKPNAALYLMKDHAGRAVHNTMYLPTMWNGNPIFEIDGIRYLNTYNDIWTPKTDDSWHQHDAWQICEQHLRNILPNDWREVLMFMAHNVQFPGKKILWAPIIVGIQGDGKTVLAKMMAAAMGAKNTKVVGLQATRSEFNSWAEGSCLAVFEEIRAPGHSRHDFMNKLKELITNDVIDVVAKGRDGRNVVNTQNYMALSNFRDALAIDEHDRRWGVFFTKFKDRSEVISTFDHDYWSRLNDYAIKGFPSVLRGWLMSIDLSSFDRNAGPKMTEAKIAMAKNSMNEHTQSVQEAIEIGGRGVSREIVSTRCLSTLLGDLERTSINTSRMSSALQTLKYKNAGIVKWDRGTHRVWVPESTVLKEGDSMTATLRSLLDDTMHR